MPIPMNAHRMALSLMVNQQLKDAHEYLEYCKENKDELHFITLFYYPKEKKWRDENGDIYYVPEALVPKYMIDIFKQQKSYFYGTMYGGSVIIELFWRDEDDTPPWDPPYDDMKDTKGGKVA